MGTEIFNRAKTDIINSNSADSKKSGHKMNASIASVAQGATSKLELYRLLVDELMKDEPDKTKVRNYCKFLRIPYSLNATTQIGTVFNRLQSLDRQVIND